MARRSSNRDRIGRMREEAAAGDREREERAKERALNPTTTPGRKKKPAPSGRMKIVWVVKDPDGNIVKIFPYPQKAAADAEAERLRAQHNRYYAVRKEKVPMDA